MRFCCRPGPASESYGCDGNPVAVIDDPDPKYQVQDVNVYFEGENSYDTDPPPEGGDSIVDYYWVWPSGSYEQDKSPDNGHLGWAKFSSTGERKVGLFVQDDEENWSTKEECTVRIVEVGLSGGGYIPVGGMDEIQLSVNPTNNWSGCKVRLSVFGDNLDCIKIWEEQGKINQVIPDGANYYKDYDPGSLPSELYVEGISTTPVGQDVDIALLYRVDSLDTDQDAIDYKVVNVDLKSVKFTSDHGSLEDKTDDWEDSDSTYSEPEWVDGDPDTNNPISHTWDTELTVDVTVEVSPSGLEFELIGDGPDDYVDFSKTGNTSTGSDQVVTITADAKLPVKIDTLAKSIDWSIKIASSSIDIETSGQHKIYVTYGEPEESSVVTEKRMSWACEKADGAEEDEDVADEIHDALADEDPPYEPSEKPDLGSGWPLLAGTTYGECDEQAELMKLACEILGVPASLDFVYPSVDTSCDEPEDPNYCPTHGYEGLRGYTGFWNDFEGVCYTASSYYAVWPKIKESTKVDVLRTWLAYPLYQGWTYWEDSDPDPSNHYWELCEIQELP